MPKSSVVASVHPSGASRAASIAISAVACTAAGNNVIDCAAVHFAHCEALVRPHDGLSSECGGCGDGVLGLATLVLAGGDESCGVFAPELLAASGARGFERVERIAQFRGEYFVNYCTACGDCAAAAACFLKSCCVSASMTMLPGPVSNASTCSGLAAAGIAVRLASAADFWSTPAHSRQQHVVEQVLRHLTAADVNNRFPRLSSGCRSPAAIAAAFTGCRAAVFASVR